MDYPSNSSLSNNLSLEICLIDDKVVLAISPVKGSLNAIIKSIISQQGLWCYDVNKDASKILHFWVPYSAIKRITCNEQNR